MAKDKDYGRRISLVGDEKGIKGVEEKKKGGGAAGPKEIRERSSHKGWSLTNLGKQ